MVFFSLILSLILGTSVPGTHLTNGAAKANNNATPAKSSTVVVEQLAWSPERRLSWEDFKASPDSTNSHHAMTAANLAVDAKCNGSKFDFSVRCVFLPTESWSKNKKSEKLLQHEQLHFDLTEVHARMLRKKLLMLGSSCTNVQGKLSDVVNIAFADWKEEQRKFDKLSKHGLDADAMIVWSADINQRLKQLENFK